MNRRALLVGAPGNPGTTGYLPGVTADLSNYSLYLQSPQGGSWLSSEIKCLSDPRAVTVRAELLALGSVDYAFVLFSGHGYIDARTNRTVAEFPKFNETIDETELRSGAPRQTVVLDCCRVVVATQFREAVAKATAITLKLDRSRCRSLFDETIQAAPRQALVVAYSCSPNETAGDTNNGGVYSATMLAGAEDWTERTARQNNTGSILTVVDAHDAARSAVQSTSGRRQNPCMEKPRSSPYFPFAVVA